MSNQLAIGQQAPALLAADIHNRAIPFPGLAGRLTHLQFRRFAGCPVCNLHLQTYIKRIDEIESAGIQEIVVFHSPAETLIPYQGQFPFSVIGDPDKTLYKRYGVDASIWALLTPKIWPVIIRANLARDKPARSMEGGPLGLPADFLVDASGRIIARHYGRHAYDQWSVDTLLALAKQDASAGGISRAS